MGTRTQKFFKVKPKWKYRIFFFYLESELFGEVHYRGKFLLGKVTANQSGNNVNSFSTKTDEKVVTIKIKYNNRCKLIKPIRLIKNPSAEHPRKEVYYT